MASATSIMARSSPRFATLSRNRRVSWPMREKISLKLSADCGACVVFILWLPPELFEDFIQLLFQRGRSERLHHITIGAGLRGSNNVLFFGFRGHHQHGQGFQVV